MANHEGEGGLVQLEIARGVPTEVVVSALTGAGLTVTINGDLMRVRWNPRYARDGEIEGAEYVPAFLRYVNSRDYDL